MTYAKKDGLKVLRVDYPTWEKLHVMKIQKGKRNMTETIGFLIEYYRKV